VLHFVACRDARRPSAATRGIAAALVLAVAPPSAATPLSAVVPPSVTTSPSAEHAPDIAASPSIYLVSHGWHVGLVLRRDDVPATAWPQKDVLGPFRYLEVGWGDGDYYPARRGTIALALRAAVGSRWSVLQVVGFDGDVPATFPRSKILRVDVSYAGVAAVADYIRRTYLEERADQPLIVAPAQYGFGFFFAAQGHYSVRNNSNTWVARALRIAGCPIDVEPAMTAGAVLHQAVRFATIVRPGVFLRGSADGGARDGGCRDAARGVV
jgi:uncharacterized protein (TIGR02117 family)